jgi:hypothetical protein
MQVLTSSMTKRTIRLRMDPCPLRDGQRITFREFFHHAYVAGSTSWQVACGGLSHHF